jgi:cytoskeletal protein CcmA (bactofilin family)
MNKTRMHNLIITGMGTTNGGNVQLARIDGNGTVAGDLDCSDFTLNGKADIHGSIKASNAEINGRITIDGDLIAENIQLIGRATVKGKCEAEKLNANGRLDIDILNAGDIQITLQGSSSITEIGGEHIEIRKHPGIDLTKLLKALSIPLSHNLTAQTIEGDYVYVEYTMAEVVRGTNVIIGPGCEIKLVEYKIKLDQDKSSKVMRIVQI